LVFVRNTGNVVQTSRRFSEGTDDSEPVRRSHISFRPPRPLQVKGTT
jgi:hypothetical protein